MAYKRLLTKSLRNLLLFGGWLLVAPVLAGFIWVLLETLAPLPQATQEQSAASAQPVVWVSQLDRFWQPQAASEPVEEIITRIEPSRLRVSIQGVLYSSRPSRSVVMLRYRNQDFTLSEGDELEEGVALAEIRQDALIFNREGRLERIDLELSEAETPANRSRLLDQEGRSSRSTASASRSRRSPQPIEDIEPNQSSSAAEPREISHHERVGTGALEEAFGPDFRESLVRDPLQLMRHITLSPHNEEGRLQGFRIRPGSDAALFNSLGLEAGDLVVAVDGTSVSDTTAMMQLHGQLATATSLDVEILRDGERLLFSLEME